MSDSRILRRVAATTTVLGAVLAAAMALPASAADVTKARLENADTEPQNWLLGFQNYSSQRYSRLNSINQNNVQNLKVAFTVPLSDALKGRATATLENHGLVDNGFMYIDAGDGVIMKVDVRTGTKGTVLWAADAKVDKAENGRSRGVAMFGNNVFHNLTNGRVVSVNRDTGEFTWDVQVARTVNAKSAGIDAEKTRENFTASPLPADGKILVGQSNGDAGTRGWLAALDPANGKELWRTYTVPNPGEPGFETWKDDHNAWKTGGAALWTTGSYDPAQRVTIWGTAQPVPMFDPEFRPGDNLFSNSVVAFDIDTGKIKWYFQYTPNESWDYDEQGVHMLVDAPFNGTMRQQVVHFGRNGFFYQVDRTNGQFIAARQYVDQVTWTAGIDPKTGKPVEYKAGQALQTYIPATRWARADALAKQSCPHAAGAVRWQPEAVDPVKKIAYSGGEDGCTAMQIVPSLTLPDGGIDEKGRSKTGTRVENDLHGLLTAQDLTTGKTIARLRQQYVNQSGALVTAGNLLFTATLDGAVTAHNPETLAELWRFETGVGIKSPVFTYAFGGKQYVAVTAGAQQPNVPDIGYRGWGAMLYVFSL